jgi:glutamate synthase domain-containing protein 3
MMQRGRIIVCGDVNANMGDSMYDGIIFVGGEPHSLGTDCVPGEMNEHEVRWLEQKIKNAEIDCKVPASKFKKYVAGRMLWNYDNLEPAEKKGILG